MELYRILANKIEENLDEFISVNRKFISILSNPGSGKTYTLIETLKRVYGKYYTANEYQVYVQSNGDELIIPAGEGNIADEDEKTFELKTNQGKDVTFVNKHVKTLVVAYNADIKKEFERKIKNSSLRNDIQNIEIKTSHSLLFRLAQKLNLFPQKNESGEYKDEKGRVVNFAKGSFTLYDIQKTLKAMNVNAFNSLPKNEFMKLSKIFYELINSYYQTDIIVTKDLKGIDELFDTAQKQLKDVEDDIREYFNSFAPKSYEFKNMFYNDMFVSFVSKMKKLINSGEIELCHDYYYKEAFLECMRNPNKLFELFSLDNDTSKFFNVIMVDEAQDLTPIMARLLIEYFKMTKRQNLPVTFVMVGDRKQAIYGFSNRVNAFEIIEKKLGKENVEKFVLNKTYRMSPSICNFVNEVTKKIGLYTEEEKLIPAYENMHGFVFDEYMDLKDFAEKIVTENLNAFVLGRTNAEILTKYVEVYNYIKKISPELAKYVNVDSKHKKYFKKLLENGINAIDDSGLLDKLRILTGKNNPSFDDLRKSDTFSKLPLWLQSFIQLTDNFSPEEINESLNNRKRKNANIQFITIHTSKGLESEYIYFLDGILENLDLNALKKIETQSVLMSVLKKDVSDLENKKKLLELEKYVLYVALTRAKRGIFLDKNLYKEYGACINNTLSEELMKNFKKKEKEDIKERKIKM